MNNHFLNIYLVVIFIFLLINGLLGNSEPKYISPVDHQLKISGSFGEIRSNHFHSGIDIKSSKGRIGDPIKCIQDGYISRIKIQKTSYGNAIYIDHPSTGHTSVYAHLDQFTPEVSDFVKSIQYQLKSFEVDIYLQDSLFVFKQGEKIGAMGNTGRSSGPHLHFEIRETKSEHPLNPFLLGIAPGDTKKPSILNIGIYDLANGFPRFIKTFNPSIKEITVSTSRVGFAIQTNDQMDGASNKNSPFGCQLTVNDSLKFKWETDRFSFDETKYVNAILDYERKKRYGQNLQYLFKLECNEFEIFKDNNWDGILEIENSNPHDIDIKVIDLGNNISRSSFKLIYNKSFNSSSHNHSNNYVPCSVDTVLTHQKFSVIIPSGVIYNKSDIKINYNTKNIDNKNISLINIGKGTMPAHKYYSVIIDISDQKDSQNLCLVKKKKNGKFKSFGGNIIGDFFYCKLDEFGEFLLVEDNTIPTISTISYNPTVKARKSWKFNIDDNLDVDGRAFDLRYTAYCKNQWLLFKYDQKNNMIVFDDFDKLPRGQNQVILTIFDDRGNKSTKILKFSN